MEYYRFQLKSFFLFFLLAFAGQSLFAQSSGQYWIGFTDKEDSPFSIDRPEEFLSPLSISKKALRGVAITESDLPPNPFYLDQIADIANAKCRESKWMNGCLVQIENPQLIEAIKALAFVREVRCVKKNDPSTSGGKSLNEDKLLKGFIYGDAEEQIDLHNGESLHFNGFDGKGMTIAVMDAGFNAVDIIASFRHLFTNGQLKGTYDFVADNDTVFHTSSHGREVLSTMTAIFHSETQDYSGTAPAADYYLFRTEDTGSETPAEEFNWLLAAERADELGVDVINTSLGYYDFDDNEDDYLYEDMDGNTAVITIAADMAAAKGMLVVNAAGNEGNDPFLHIIAPADADSVLTVGAVNNVGELAEFSSRGPSADGRVKPDVVAVGADTYLIGNTNLPYTGNGTSYASPIMAGLAACLWQSAPEKTNMEVYEAIVQSASQYATPDSLMGYGIPNFEIAYELLNGKRISSLSSDISVQVFPNPSAGELFLTWFSETESSMFLSIRDASGRVTEEFEFTGTVGEYNGLVLDQFADLSAGMYFLSTRIGDKRKVSKVIKVGP